MGIKLTIEEYDLLPKAERVLLRRLAFGYPRPACFVPVHDLEHLRTILVQRNEDTGWFAGKWTDEEDLDGLEDLL